MATKPLETSGDPQHGFDPGSYVGSSLYKKDMYFLMGLYGISLEDAEDHIQTALEVFLKKDKGLKFPREYFTSTFIHKTIDLLRRVHRHQDIEYTPETVENTGLIDRQALRPVEKLIDELSLQRVLNQAVSNLNPLQKQVVLLSEEGLQNKQIAVQLQRTEGAIKALAWRARRNMRKFLASNDDILNR